MSNTEYYVNRRKRLAETMADNSFYFVCSGKLVESTDDAEYIFQPYRNFVYLTGRKDVDATLVITKINGKVNETLFMHIPTEMELRWMGTRFDAESIKEKTGVKIDGVSAVNPLTKKEIPIYISDYVLMSYGTGAIMAVPAHDTRDWDFAKAFNLPIIEVVADSA